MVSLEQSGGSNQPAKLSTAVALIYISSLINAFSTPAAKTGNCMLPGHAGRGCGFNAHTEEKYPVIVAAAIIVSRITNLGGS